MIYLFKICVVSLMVLLHFSSQSLYNNFRSSVPKALQANKSLLMKAVSEAEKSVTTSHRGGEIFMLHFCSHLLLPIRNAYKNILVDFKGTPLRSGCVTHLKRNFLKTYIFLLP